MVTMQYTKEESLATTWYLLGLCLCSGNLALPHRVAGCGGGDAGITAGAEELLAGPGNLLQKRKS